jgi:RimJ/RimL family protein N-acetyltransferase
MYLPSAWNKGYASESIGAVFAACGRVKAKNFWDPYQTVYVRALVNEENPASARVTEKVGMKRLGVHVWKGREPVVIAGKERWEDRIVIFGGWVGEAGLKAEDEG